MTKRLVFELAGGLLVTGDGPYLAELTSSSLKRNIGINGGIMKKSKKISIIVVVILALLTAGVILYLVCDSKSRNTELVDAVESMIEAQSKVEANFELGGFTIDEPNIILNPYGNSPLSALVVFDTDEAVIPRVTIVGKDENSTFTHEFSEGTTHRLPIYGLYADKNNEIIIEYNDIKKTVNIETAALPENIPLPTEVHANKDKLGSDLYFFTPSSTGVTGAYDVNGDVRWYVTNHALWKIDRLENGHLLVSTERPVNAPYYMTGLYEIDLLGKIYNEYSLPGGYHHDYYEMKNGNLLVASDDFVGEAGTVEDVIVELNRETGQIVKTFDLKDILNMEDGQSEGWTAYDWFHNNSVWYDEATTSITLSGRHQDAVINIDYETGELNWIIGDPTSWSEEYQKYFFTPIGELEWQWSQHAAMITPEGYVFILDNGNNKSKLKEEYVPASESYTRGVMYKIDTDEMTIEQIWQYGKERGSEFYSPYISDVDYLAEGHYIVHSGGIVYQDGVIQNSPAGLVGADKLVSDTVEVLNDEVIFEIKLPTNNYRVEKMSLYVANDNFTTGKGNRLGTLGITEPTDTKRGFILSSKKIDDYYQSRNIEITKETDRLVVKGQFTRENEVNIILYQNMRSDIHNIRVSKKPYTALCVDVFTEEENENGIVVTKYINDDGLRGEHSIYVEIDDVVYNTERYVVFGEE